MTGRRPGPGEGLRGDDREPPDGGFWSRFRALKRWRLLKRLDDLDRRADAVEVRLDEVERSLGLCDGRIGSSEARLDRVETKLGEVASEHGAAAARMDVGEQAHRDLQAVVEELGVHRVATAEDRIDRVEAALGRTDEEVARLRDGTVPAAVRRADVLLERLSLEIEETASLVERSLLGEPLPVLKASPVEDGISRSLAHLQPALLEALRGPGEEISHRLAANLPLVRDHAPVLDLGCGRGEFLDLLREAGVDALGVDGDAALVQGARRRGLPVQEGDVLESMREFGAGRFGAITAIHLLEHLAPGRICEVLAEARRVLRPGGVLIAECPNPHSLRVGGALFWLDPTHVRPLLPETLQLLLRASGFEVTALEFRHPFPDDQLVVGGEGASAESGSLSARINEIERRFDATINGPRDFMVAAKKPVS